jgi:Ser-tRNA(Ala) deacylase AlaX
MPTISVFYGLIIRMFYQDHSPPHIHIDYQGENTTVAIKTGEILEGKLSNRNKKLIDAWIEIHEDELLANWELCKNAEKPLKIKPL